MTEIDYGLYRMKIWDLEELIELHDQFPLKSIKELLEELEIEGDYTEFGT